MLDLPLSLTIARRIIAVPKRCWGNALTALRTQRQLGKAYYVEGWLVKDKPLVIEHGWVELPDGRIIDPTYALLVVQQSVGAPPAYFPGVRYSRKELKGIQLKALPCVWKSGGFEGLQHPQYKKAYEEASKYVTGEEKNISKGYERMASSGHLS